MKKGNAMFYGAMMLTGANLLLRFVSMGFQVYLSPANRRRRHRPSAIDLLSGGALLYPGLCRGPDLRHVPVARGPGPDRPQAIGSVLSGCARYSLCFSLPVALCLWVFAPAAASGWLGNAAAAPSLRTYALSLSLACFYGVMTGFFTAAGLLFSGAPALGGLLYGDDAVLWFP